MKELCSQIPNSSAVEVDAVKRMIDPSSSSEWRRNIAREASAFLAGQLLGAGRSVVTETHTRWPVEKELFHKVARAIPDVVFSSVLVVAPRNVCLARAQQRFVPGIAYPIDQAMVDAYYVNLESLPEELVVDTTQHSPAESAVRVLDSLGIEALKRS